MRKLAIAAGAFSAAVFAAIYALQYTVLLPAAILLGAAAFLLCALNPKANLRYALISGFLALGFGFYLFYFQNTAAIAERLDGRQIEISGRILEYPRTEDGSLRFELRLLGRGSGRIKAVAYVSDQSMSEAEPGQYVRLRAVAKNADELFGNSYDAYYSDGVFLKLDVKELLEHDTKPHLLLSLPCRIGHRLGESIDGLFPDDVSVFMKSLMLGDKEEFYKNDAQYVAMTRSGFMHVVAVSGMHIAFLVSLLRLLLGNGRRATIMILGLLWFFVLLTGSSPSAIRAGFMQSLLLMAPLLRRENDAPTSLALILAIILLFNPFAAKSISLQLSFGAMAGILCFSESLYAAVNGLFSRLRGRTLFSYIAASVSSSLSVMVFTLPLTALHFDYVPLLSVITNLAALWAVSLCFCGGWLCCALSVVPLLGRVSAWLCAWIARYILFVADFVADSPYALLYTATAGITLWIIGSYFAISLAFCIKKRRRLAVFAAALLSLLSLIGILHTNRRSYQATDIISVLDVGQGQCIAAFSGENTVLIDCGSIYTIDNAGDRAGEYLLRCGRKRVDLLFLTHLHSDHANGVPRLLEIMDVDKIIMPMCPDIYDYTGRAIIEAAARQGAEIELMGEDGSISCGKINIDAYAFLDGEDENERCLMARLSIDDYDLLITADADMEMENRLASRLPLSDVESIIVGHHGSRYASSPLLLKAVGGGKAIISVGYNTYGHPTRESLERLEQYGYNIYRTDEIGPIEIRIG